MPESEALYPADMVTEERYAQRVEELIREAALEGVHDELPRHPGAKLGELADARLESIGGLGQNHELGAFDDLRLGESPGARQHRGDPLGRRPVAHGNTNQCVARAGEPGRKHRTKRRIANEPNTEPAIALLRGIE